MAGQPAPQSNPGDKITTTHGQEFMRKQLLAQIDMRHPLSAEDVMEICDEFGVNEQDVMNLYQSYMINKAKDRDDDLTQYVQDAMNEFFPPSADKRLPTFDEFYKKFITYRYDENFSSDEVKKKFIELTTDKNQLSLFELRNRIKKMIWENIS